MAISEVSRVTTQSAGDTPAQASVALVPVVAAPRRPAVAQGLTRPDPCFVTHLIAMAEMSPQTRSLRRAAPKDVQAADRALANQNQIVKPPGVPPRLIDLTSAAGWPARDA